MVIRKSSHAYAEDMQRRIDTVTIPLSLESVALPWDSREGLLKGAG
jgi:hypothetical protein